MEMHRDRIGQIWMYSRPREYVVYLIIGVKYELTQLKLMHYRVLHLDNSVYHELIGAECSLIEELNQPWIPNRIWKRIL